MPLGFLKFIMIKNNIIYSLIAFVFINLSVPGQSLINNFDKNGKTLLINAVSKNDFTKVKHGSRIKLGNILWICEDNEISN